MPDPADPAVDPYKTLQVDPEADPEVIQAAYRRLAQKFHPDLAGSDPVSAARMVAINSAWEILGDPDRRAEHDRRRGGERRGPRGPVPRPPATPSWRPTPAQRPAPAERPSETVSRDWTSGRSSYGGGYDPATMRAPEGHGAAGPPPGPPSGSALTFGRYAGWSLGEIARTDIDYLEWLDRMPIGRPYRDEIDGLLRRTGRRHSSEAETRERRGLFRRR